MTLLKFYQGTYLYARGDASILAVATNDREGGFVTFAFVFIEKTPSPNSIFEFHFTKQKYPQKDTDFGKFGIDKYDQFLVGEAFRAGKSILRNIQIEEFDRTKAAVALNDLKFGEIDHWSLELLRLRLRGLPKDIVQEISKQIGDKDVSKVLKEIEEQWPIQVTDVITRQAPKE